MTAGFPEYPSSQNLNSNSALANEFNLLVAQLDGEVGEYAGYVQQLDEKSRQVLEVFEGIFVDLPDEEEMTTRVRDATESFEDALAEFIDAHVTTCEETDTDPREILAQTVAQIEKNRFNSFSNLIDACEELMDPLSYEDIMATFREMEISAEIDDHQKDVVREIAMSAYFDHVEHLLEDHFDAFKAEQTKEQEKAEQYTENTGRLHKLGRHALDIAKIGAGVAIGMIAADLVRNRRKI